MQSKETVKVIERNGKWEIARPDGSNAYRNLKFDTKEDAMTIVDISVKVEKKWVLEA